MGEKIGIKGYDSFVEAGEPTQDLDIKLSIRVKANEYASFVEKFLKEFQTFLDERK